MPVSIDKGPVDIVKKFSDKYTFYVLSSNSVDDVLLIKAFPF